MTGRIGSALAEVQRSADNFSDRELAATLLGAIAVAGPLFGFFTYLLPHPEGTDFVTPSIAFAASLIAGAVLWRRRRTVGWTAISVVVALGALGALVVTVTMLSVPGRTAAYATYYVWLGVFAFYFLSTRAALAQVAWVALLYAVAVAVDEPVGAMEQWLNGVVTTLGVGLLVLALRVRIAGLVARLQAVAATDELTGLPNRRAFDEQLARELERCAREEAGVSVALLDLDGFKQLNDSVGHPAGDRALQAVAQIMRAEIRAMDWPARIGGDEFAVLLPGAAEADAARIARELRRAIRRAFGDEDAPLSASIGVTASAGRAVGLEELFGEADGVLYAAKRLGGNRVALASGPTREPHLSEMARGTA